MPVAKEVKVRAYLEDAELFLDRGREEVVEGLRKGDQLKVRDGAEKLWSAVVSATNALILHLLDTIPASHWERRRLLDKVEDLNPKARDLGLRDRYGARERYLHMMTFHDGIIDHDMLQREVSKVEKYLQDVKNLIQEGQWGAMERGKGTVVDVESR